MLEQDTRPQWSDFSIPYMFHSTSKTENNCTTGKKQKPLASLGEGMAEHEREMYRKSGNMTGRIQERRLGC